MFQQKQLKLFKMKITYINFLQTITLITICLLTLSCKKDEGFSGNTDITNDLTFTIPFSFIPGDSIIWEEDVQSGINAEINDVINDHENAEVRTLEIISVSLVSSDVSDFSYLDSIAIHMVASDPTDISEYGIPDDAQIISSIGSQKLSEASYNADLQNTDVKNIFTNNDNYDIYYECFLNDGIIPIQQDRIVEVRINFRAMISN